MKIGKKPEPVKGPQMHFRPWGVSVPIQGHSSVLEAALAAKLPLNNECGGMGTCTTCRVIVESSVDKLNARNEQEAEMAEMKSFTPRERLACQMAPVEGLIVRIPDID